MKRCPYLHIIITPFCGFVLFYFFWEMGLVFCLSFLFLLFSFCNGGQQYVLSTRISGKGSSFSQRFGTCTGSSCTSNSAPVEPKKGSEVMEGPCPPLITLCNSSSIGTSFNCEESFQSFVCVAEYQWEPSSASLQRRATVKDFEKLKSTSFVGQGKSLKRVGISSQKKKTHRAL